MGVTIHFEEDVELREGGILSTSALEHFSNLLCLRL